MTEETPLFNNPLALVVNNSVVNILNFDDITYGHLKNNAKFIDLKGNPNAATIGDTYNPDTKIFTPLSPDAPETLNISVEQNVFGHFVGIIKEGVYSKWQ